MEKKRVVIFGAGNVGAIAARCIQGRDNMELVGVWGHVNNIGMDAGLLDGSIPTGVFVTDSEEEIIALKPDCALVGINVIQNIDEIVGGLFIRLLESGINVVSVSIPGLIHPKSYTNPKLVKDLEKACDKGNTSFYSSGEEPGFAEQMVALMLTGSNTVKSVHTYEIFRYDSVDDEEWMGNLFGFGKTMDFTPIMMVPGVQSSAWGAPIHYVANALGYKVDEIKETYERMVADKDIEVNFGTIKAGTVGAVRFKTIGMIEGREAVAVEHVNRMSADIAPEWPQAHRDGVIRIEIAGDPNISCDFAMGDVNDPKEMGYNGYVLTTMRVLNAVPYVCDAPKGLLTSLDLPLTLPRNAFKSDAIKIDHKVVRNK